MSTELTRATEWCRGEIRWLAVIALVFLASFGSTVWFASSGRWGWFAVYALCVVVDGAFVVKVARSLMHALVTFGAEAKADGQL